MPDLSKLSDEKLLAENEKLMAQKDEVRERQREIAAELDRRANEAWAASLSPGQRDVLINGVTAQAKGGRG